MVSTVGELKAALEEYDDETQVRVSDDGREMLISFHYSGETDRLVL